MDSKRVAARQTKAFEDQAESIQSIELHLKELDAKLDRLLELLELSKTVTPVKAAKSK